MTGDADGCMPLAPTRRWEGTAGGPGSQETTSDHKAEQPSWKGVAHAVKHAIKAGAAALGMVAAVAVAPAAAFAAAPKVTVTVQGKTRTLLPAASVQTSTGWITRGGAPTGKCPADSAQGALNVATKGRWQGKWYASYHEYYITGILGDKETSKKYYWALYVNGKSSSKGACDVKLKSGDKVLFKVVKG